MKTFSLKNTEVARDWVVFDASEKVLGRFATKIADKLRGKDKPSFTPHVDGGDGVFDQAVHEWFDGRLRRVRRSGGDEI